MGKKAEAKNNAPTAPSGGKRNSKDDGGGKKNSKDDGTGAGWGGGKKPAQWNQGQGWGGGGKSKTNPQEKQVSKKVKEQQRKQAVE